MSATEQMQAVPDNIVETPLSLRELTVLLIKHYSLHEGHYEPLIEYQVGMGSAGPSPETVAPSAIIGISRLGLVRAGGVTPTTVDAGQVNPAKKPKKKP
jgi:hypothetical protein